VVSDRDHEQISLPTPPRGEPNTWMKLLFLGLLFGSIVGGLLAADWSDALPYPWMRTLGSFAGILVSFSGGVPFWSLPFLWLTAPTKPPLIELNPLLFKVGKRSIPWGEMREVERLDTGVRVVRDNGKHTDLFFVGARPQHLDWLCAHLQHRLGGLAPGAPEDLPKDLARLAAKEMP
jgi:hypothetical protein